MELKEKQVNNNNNNINNNNKNKYVNKQEIKLDDYYEIRLSEEYNDTQEITDNYSSEDEDYEYDYQYAYTDESKNNTDESTFLFETDSDSEEKKLQNDADRLQEELNKPYKYTQKTHLSALYCISMFGWCLGGKLVPIGERQKPVIDLVAPILGGSLELCIHFIKQYQIRTDGTHRNKYINKSIWKYLQEEIYPKGVIHHKASDENYDKQDYVYNLFDINYKKFLLVTYIHIYLIEFVLNL